MPQGNAIFHLMPPPFYAYRYVVAKARAPEESIQDQIDKIVDASATNRYKVEVMPGIYAEDVTMKAYVDVVAPYGRAVIRPPSGDTFGVTMASNSMLQGLQVDLQTIVAGGVTGVIIGALTNAYVEDCWITGGGATDIGISDASTGTSVIIRRCRIDGAATGYRKTGTGTTWFYDNRVTGAIQLRSVQGAVADDGGVQTDETTEANDATANDMTLLPAAPAINDAYYFGGLWPFQQISLNVGTAGVKGAGGWTITWEYYNEETGAWATLTVTDGTSEFTIAGTHTITFTAPPTWGSTAVAGITAYWVRARVSAASLPITTQPLGTQAWVTDAIDIDVDAGTLNLIENELMYDGTGANVDVAAATITINSYGNTLAGDGWRIGDDADAKVYSHNDNFQKVNHAGAGFMIAKEEPRTYLVHDGMKIGDALTDIAAIGDASDTHRYMIRVFTGEYAEAVTMAQYIDLVGESAESVVISQAATNVITAAANSRIKGVRVELTAGSGQAGIYINNVAAVLEEVRIIVTRASGSNSGVQTAGTGGVTAYGADIYANNTNDYPGNFAGSGTHVIYDSYFENGAGAGAYDINVASSTVNSFNNKLMGDGWNIANAATAIVRSHTDYFTTVTKGADGVMTCQEKPNVWRVFNGMEIADAHTAASAGDVIEVGPGTYTEALAISKALTITAIDTAERTTITQADANVITLTAAATIQGFTINVSAAAAARTGVVCASYSAHIRDCTFTQAGTAGYGITVTTGSPVIEHCTFSSGLDDAIRQTSTGGTVVSHCRILSGATNGVNAADGTVTISHSRVSVAGTGLNSSASASEIWADHCDITGTTIDINVAAGCLCYADGCTYNDVTNAGTFADLTGCREYACAVGVAVGEWVYAQAAGDTVAEARSDALATMPTIGVVVYKPTTTTCKVKNYGYVYDSTDPWTAGDEYWVDWVTAGAITNVMPPVWPQRAGVAVATDRLKILIGDNLGLVQCNEYTVAGAGQAVGEWVYITTTNDTAAEAQANAAATMPAIGVIVDKPTATRALVKLRGKYAEASRGWTASDDVYISAVTAGQITIVMPVGGIIQKVAEVKSDDLTTIIYELGD